MGMFSTRRAQPSPAELDADCAPGPRDEKVCPSLWEFLALRRFDDGTARQAGSMTVFVDDGRLKVALSDKEGGMVGFVSLDELADLAKDLEKAILSGKVDWRKQKDTKGKR